ncbi:MAG: hypothetical protein WCG16_13785 [Methylococcales bacterium]
MKTLVRILSSLVFSFVGTAAGHAADWQIIEAAYVALPVPSTQYGVVCSAYETSVCANVGDFYRFNHQTQLRVALVGAISDQWGVRLSLTTGAEATKLVVDPQLIIGVIATKPLTKGRSLSGEVFGSIGGDIRHKPCLDEYDREYFCGNLTAWTDFQSKTIANEEYGLKIVFKY